jgi:hypothetical protein
VGEEQVGGTFREQDALHRCQIRFRFVIMLSLEEKIRNILVEVSRDNKFDFAAIIEREDASGRWDLAISAKWIDEYPFLETIAPKLSAMLSDSELINLGRIVVLNPDGEFMQEYNQRIGPTDKDRDLFNITIAGIPVRHAHVFGAQAPLMYA